MTTHKTTTTSNSSSQWTSVQKLTSSMRSTLANSSSTLTVPIPTRKCVYHYFIKSFIVNPSSKMRPHQIIWRILCNRICRSNNISIRTMISQDFTSLKMMGIWSYTWVKVSWRKRHLATTLSIRLQAVTRKGTSPLPGDIVFSLNLDWHWSQGSLVFTFLPFPPRKSQETKKSSPSKSESTF